MDWRWTPVNPDSKREVKIILHPTAAIYEVRRGLDPGSDDSVDLSEFVRDASQTAFEVNVTLAFNRELFGAYQPKPNQVLEVQLLQKGEWLPLWIGFVDSINSFTMSRGERQMQLIAKTRDQLDIWRNTPRVTQLYPQLTNITYMIQQVARMTDMKGDEIVLPPSSITNAHSNMQLADMTAWDMVTQMAFALGWTPFIDGTGRLRMADRGLQGRSPDIKLTAERMVKVGGQRQRPPVNRVRVSWLDPVLKKWMQQGRLLRTFTVGIGWWLPYWHTTQPFSDDKTQRATEVSIVGNPGINAFVNFCKVTWKQQTENTVKVSFHNEANFALVASLMVELHFKISTRSDTTTGTIPVATPAKDQLYAAGFGVNAVSGVINQAPGTLETVPTMKGSLGEAITSAALMAAMLNIGSGLYEIWGKPYNWVHAKNVSEAFDSSVPIWVNNVSDIECDFVTNEEHAKAIAIRELIYAAQATNKWSVSIVDDPRVEYGDILQFPDGSQLFVEDFSRALGRGSDATLDVKGFLVGGARGKGKSIVIPGGTPDIGVGAPGGPGGGPEAGGGTEPPPPAESAIPQPPDLGNALIDVKARLVANGEDISGWAIGKICRQFAYEHANDTPYPFGLLSKSGGTNWEGCSTDYLVYGTETDYRLQDVISSSGNIQWGDFRSPDDAEKGRFVKVTSNPGYL